MSETQLCGVLRSQGPGVGDPAPDFELPALIGGVRKSLHLSAYRGQKSVVLAFYPFNWQEPSAHRLRGYQAQRARVLASNAETIAITVDSIMNTRAWERIIGPFDFPLCSDFWPHGEVSKRYGIFEASGNDPGASLRAVIGIDRAGTIVFRKIYAAHVFAPLEDVLTVLEAV